MFPLTPDQHHWLEVATEDEGCNNTNKTGSEKYMLIYRNASTPTRLNA